MLGGETRGEPAAEREADQIDLVESERIEQIQIVHDVVMDAAHRRIVVGFAESGMERNDDAEFLRPWQSKIDPMPNSGTMKEHQRRPAAGGKHAGLYAIDRVRFALELPRKCCRGHLNLFLTKACPGKAEARLSENDMPRTWSASRFDRIGTRSNYSAATRRCVAVRARMRGVTS